VDLQQNSDDVLMLEGSVGGFHLWVRVDGRMDPPSVDSIGPFGMTQPLNARQMNEVISNLEISRVGHPDTRAELLALLREAATAA
jgi:hypothetical protein